jgi:hypothetical protein
VAGQKQVGRQTGELAADRRTGHVDGYPQEDAGHRLQLEVDGLQRVDGQAHGSPGQALEGLAAQHRIQRGPGEHPVGGGRGRVVIGMSSRAVLGGPGQHRP